MRKKSPELKLHIQPSVRAVPSQETELAPIEAACSACSTVSGWRFTFVPGEQTPTTGEWFARVGEAEWGGWLCISATAIQPTLSLEQTKTLAAGVMALITDVRRSQHALCQREAELAAGIPVTSRPNDKKHLAERLKSVLQSGAQALSCQAAALYLLDDATTELKLRASFGLPVQRLLQPPRPLQGAIADLEALVGHAVVLENTALLPHWKVPEEYPSAVCVPVSTATMPLGTLWFFGEQEQDYTGEQTNLAEIVAGRIAADLEREILLREGVRAKEVKKQFGDVVAWQQRQITKIVPVVEGWQLASWSQQVEGVGGDFLDWNVLPDGRFTMALGDARGRTLAAGFTAAAVQAALRAHATYRHTADELLTKLHETVWANSTGEDLTSLMYAMIDPAAQGLEVSFAGEGALLIVRKGKHELLSAETPLLGSVETCRPPRILRSVMPGDILIGMTSGVREAKDRGGLQIGEAALANLVRRGHHFSANELATRIQQLLRENCPQQAGADRAIMIAKQC